MKIPVRISSGIPLSGDLVFVYPEESFNFRHEANHDFAERIGELGSTSLLIGTLQIEVGVATGQLLFVWGWLPRSSWRNSSLIVPNATPGVARIDEVEDLRAGVSLEVSSRGEWATETDSDSGWIRISANAQQAEEHILFASGSVLGVRSCEIVSLWLNPSISTT